MVVGHHQTGLLGLGLSPLNFLYRMQEPSCSIEQLCSICSKLSTLTVNCQFLVIGGLLKTLDWNDSWK